jgi:hypothetical protein
LLKSFVKPMFASAYSTQVTLHQLVDRILITRRLTRADQQRFMKTALSNGFLNGDERRQIDRVLDALKRGMVKVVD